VVRATGGFGRPDRPRVRRRTPNDPGALAAAVDDLLARKLHLASRRPVGEIGHGASPSAKRSLDLAAVLRHRAL
jgi:hypothetical protein